MSESTFKRHVRDELKQAGAHVTAHQDKFTTGIPDLSIGFRGATYWLELKVGVNPAHLGISAAQELWLVERGHTAGHCGLLAEIKGEWWLWGWRHVPALRAGREVPGVLVPPGGLPLTIVEELL